MGKVLKLYVYLNTQYVGILTQSSSGAMSFQYAQSWINKFPDYSISLSLPVQKTEYKGDEVFSYFDNLLPDNDDIRKSVAAKINAKSARTFDLLGATGRDCVGALRFLTDQVDKNELEPVEGLGLNNKQVGEVISSLKSFPLGMDTSEFRLSIAGAQEKTALLSFKNQWLKPIGQTPTTHILKPPMGQLQSGIDLKTSVSNEWVCLKLCHFFGLDTADSFIEEFGEKKCLVVKRFDRLWIGEDTIARIAQEDMCQALKYSSSRKYETDGGPGIKEIMNFLDASINRDKDKYDFMKSQIIFWIMGATDGHAKNYSVFLRKEGFFLTPFYDVMSMYPSLDSKQVNLREMKLAFKVGKSRKDRLDKIQIRHFFETASDCGFSHTELLKIIDEIKSKKKEDFYKMVKESKMVSEDILESIVENTFKNIKRLET